jgi:hypothetical protein
MPEMPRKRTTGCCGSASVLVAVDVRRKDEQTARMTPTDVDVHCRCGILRGKLLGVSAETGSRMLCYCRDCQAFARFLGTPGMLDAQGGSEVFQTTQAQLRLASGQDKLACVRLSDKGLLRFYASCCRSPIGNMLARRRSPFLGIAQPFMDPGVGRTLDPVLGPVILSARSGAATAPLPPNRPKPNPILGVTHILRVIAASVLFGKHTPTPFFDANDKLVVTPEILTPERHQALRAGAAAS